MSEVPATRPRLTRDDLVAAARILGVEPAALAAVADVEATGSGFLPSGLPKILFEAHIFWQRLKVHGLDPEVVRAAHPTICQPTWAEGRRYYVGGQGEWPRMWTAQRYHVDAAYESASWGLFQLMGFNFRAAGFPTVRDFVVAHKRSERDHLDAIGRWMQSNGLARRLAAKDWDAFARGYNGPGQVEVYARRLRNAYERRVADGLNRVAEA